MFDFGEEFFKMITTYCLSQGNILVNFSPNAQTYSWNELTLYQITMVTITFQPGGKSKEIRTKYTCISDDNPAKNKV